MNFEAVKIRLGQMEQAIRTETLSLGMRPQGVDPGSATHARIMAQAEAWQRDLDLIHRDLKSQSNWNQTIHDRSRSGRGDFSEQQRFKDREANVAKLMAAAARVGQALAELLAALGAGPSGEHALLKGLSRSMDHLAKGLAQGHGGADLGLAQREVTATIRQLQPQGPGPGGPPSAGPVDIFTLVLSLFVLLKRKRGGGSGIA